MNAVNRNKTHCDKGHGFTEENTYQDPRGGRACRTCRREIGRRAAAASRARAKAARKPPVVIMGLPSGIWARLEIRDCGYKTPCLVWTGTIASNGYGVVGIKGRQHKLHRLVFEAVNGPMSEQDERGKRIVSDHLCRNRACANPQHIEPVTDAVNVMRGISFAPANAAKTHCERGHEFTIENTSVDIKGHRACRECRRANDRKKDAERRAQTRAAAENAPRQTGRPEGRKRRERTPKPPKPKRVPKQKPEPKPVELAPCGTRSAHTRHVRHKEPIDQACREAHAEHMRQQRAKKKDA